MGNQSPSRPTPTRTNDGSGALIPAPAQAPSVAEQRIGELLIADGHITAEARDRALAYQREQGGRFGDALLALGIINEDDWVTTIAHRADRPVANFGANGIDPASLTAQEAAALLSEEFCRAHQCLAFSVNGGKIFVAMADPNDIATQDTIHSRTGYRVEVFVTALSKLSDAIAKAYTRAAELSEERSVAAIINSGDDTSIEDITDVPDEVSGHELERAAQDAPIVKLVHAIIHAALLQHASDIHVEYVPGVAGGGGKCRVRFRVDGVARTYQDFPRRILRPVISRIKVLARLDIAERREPQDGRIAMRVDKRDIEFRVAVAPVTDGEEALVLRILSAANLEPDLEKLGMLVKHQLPAFRHAISEPNGIVLVTGPTGSGKTTTLYSALANLNTPDRVILTIEDPVEYRIPGIRQTPVNPPKVTFATALRSFLRQDPNVILVGEIRDFETAEIAIKAAMTGHLVLSTLHTNSAATAVERLGEMGVEHFLMAASFRCVTAQRLLRTVCTRCAVPLDGEGRDAIITQLVAQGVHEQHARHGMFVRGTGCDACGGSGYRGRIAVHEVLDFADGDLRDAVIRREGAVAIQRLASAKQMQAMWWVAMRRVLEGKTTLEEALRAVRRESREHAQAGKPG